MAKPSRLPMDQNTIFGYFVEVCFATTVSETYFDVNGGFCVLFISMCFHHQAFTNIFNYLIDKLNECNRRKPAEEIIYHLIRFRVLVQK